MLGTMTSKLAYGAIHLTVAGAFEVRDPICLHETE